MVLTHKNLVANSKLGYPKNSNTVCAPRHEDYENILEV